LLANDEQLSTLHYIEPKQKGSSNGLETLKELKEDIIRERILSSTELKIKGKSVKNETKIKSMMEEIIEDSSSEARDMIEPNYRGG
jgi:hypothetical protein